MASVYLVVVVVSSLELDVGSGEVVSALVMVMQLKTSCQTFTRPDRAGSTFQEQTQPNHERHENNLSTDKRTEKIYIYTYMYIYGYR